MSSYHCIAIGINNYKYIQPLSYGQADAIEVEQLLRQAGHLSPEETLLFSDSSPHHGQRPTYPDYQTLHRWFNPSQPAIATPTNTSTLWFFFSGYGAHYQGEDYLLPIDANPQNFMATAIPLRQIFQWLIKQGAHRVFVCLDMNRSLAPHDGNQPLGSATAHLANQLGISLLLSCQPGQYSHEASALGHGMFTATVLEAIRYYGVDLSLGRLENYVRERLGELSQHYWRPLQVPLLVTPSLDSFNAPILPFRETPVVPWPVAESALHPQPVALVSGQRPTTKINFSPAIDGHNAKKEDQNQDPFNLGALLKGILSGLGLIHQGVTMTQRKKLSLSAIATQGAGLTVAVISALFGIRWGSEVLQENATEGNNGEIAGEVEPGAISPGTPGINPFSSNTPADTQAFTEARNRLKDSQAYRLRQAIAKAQEIPADSPLYEAARADIQRWSSVILDIAEARAFVHDYQGAIAAAKLISGDVPGISDLTQTKLREWEIAAKEFAQQKAIFDRALGLIQPSQASSYSDAIKILREVGPGDLGYDHAQELKNQWSRSIYLLANSRAAQGNFESAIAAARLVPDDSPEYAQALGAISRWQQGKK